MFDPLNGRCVDLAGTCGTPRRQETDGAVALPCDVACASTPETVLGSEGGKPSQDMRKTTGLDPRMN